jgi:hypothetical protein
MRADAETTTVTGVKARNRLFSRNHQGGWDPAIDIDHLSSSQRGLIWFTWRSSVDGNPALAFRGVLAIDNHLQHLIEGLDVRDSEGRPCVGEQTGTSFVLGQDDAKVFISRVRQLGGGVVKSEPVPEDVMRAADQAEALVANLERTSQEDDTVVARADSGDLTVIPEFEQRAAVYADARSSVTELARTCREATAGLIAQGRTITEQATASGLLDRCVAAQAQVGALCEQRAANEQHLALLIHGGRKPKASAGSRALLYREIARLAVDAGRETRTAPGGLLIRLPEGDWLSLPSFTVSSDH